MVEDNCDPAGIAVVTGPGTLSTSGPAPKKSRSVQPERTAGNPFLDGSQSHPYFC